MKKVEVELVVQSISTILIRLKCICMYELQNTNYVILMILQMSKTFLYLLLKLTLHNIKMNSKIYASDLRFFLTLVY